MKTFVKQVYHVSNNPVKPIEYHKTPLSEQIYKFIL